jgi:outer membrane lipoprotein
MDSKYLRLTGLIMLLSVMAACTTVEPFPIPANNPPLASVRENIAAHQNQYVAWGGTILGIEIKQTVTLVTMLAKPINSNGEPIQADQSYGRFIARFSGFLDPAIFVVGRSLTISGTLQGSEMHKIGDFDYAYPIVNVDIYRLWSTPIRSSYDPYYGYGWYDPWYPWYPGYPVYPVYPAYPIYYPPPYYPPAKYGPAPRKTAP